MSIRDTLKKRAEELNAPKGSSINEGLPEGVTRYVKLGPELKDGKQFVMLADPEDWYFYYVHEDAVYGGPTFVKKHTCLHSPRKVGEDFNGFKKPGKDDCISCRAGAKRKLYFMVPVFDLEHKTWRVLDLKEFHANNLIGDYDKLEKTAKKFNKSYKLVGDVVELIKADKTYSMSSGDAELDEYAALIAEAATTDIPYADLAYFRDEDDIIELLKEADGTKIDKSVLGGGPTNAQLSKTDVDEGPVEIDDSELPF